MLSVLAITLLAECVIAAAAKFRDQLGKPSRRFRMARVAA